MACWKRLHRLLLGAEPLQADGSLSGVAAVGADVTSSTHPAPPTTAIEPAANQSRALAEALWLVKRRSQSTPTFHRNGRKWKRLMLFYPLSGADSTLGCVPSARGEESSAGTGK